MRKPHTLILHPDEPTIFYTDEQRNSWVLELIDLIGEQFSLALPLKKEIYEASITFNVKVKGDNQ